MRGGKGKQQQQSTSSKQDGQKLSKVPTVTICTPTFNRRPFWPMTIRCVAQQDYPAEKIEWLVLDDGTDSVEDLLNGVVPNVRYTRVPNGEKWSIGKKRNWLNAQAQGEVIVYMDDDDYYPPQRISHAVETLRQNPKIMIAGSSAMYMFFRDLNKRMILYGPHGKQHATAATFAFRRALLRTTSFQEGASLAEEKHFLKNYTVPMVQLDPRKTILVIAHNHNSFDKRQLLVQGNPHVHDTSVQVEEMVGCAATLSFLLDEMGPALEAYDAGKPEHKTDVNAQLNTMKTERAQQQQQLNQKQQEYMDTVNTLLAMNGMPPVYDGKTGGGGGGGGRTMGFEDFARLEMLERENAALREQNMHLKTKLQDIILARLQEANARKKEKKDKVLALTAAAAAAADMVNCDGLCIEGV